MADQGKMFHSGADRQNVGLGTGPGVYYFETAMTGIDCIVALKALGEETRLRILRLLFKEPSNISGCSFKSVDAHVALNGVPSMLFGLFGLIVLPIVLDTRGG